MSVYQRRQYPTGSFTTVKGELEKGTDIPHNLSLDTNSRDGFHWIIPKKSLKTLSITEQIHGSPMFQLFCYPPKHVSELQSTTDEEAGWIGTWFSRLIGFLIILCKSCAVREQNLNFIDHANSNGTVEGTD